MQALNCFAVSYLIRESISSMPRSINGIGTVHFGRAEQTDDGTYVATLWVVFLFLPLFPLRSERLLLLSEFNNGFGHRRVRYSVIERVPLHQGQIIRTYLAGWGVLLWYVSLWWLFAPIERIVGQGHEPWIAIGWMLLPFAVLLGWQRLYMPRPKLKPVELSPSSEHRIYQQADGTSAKPAAQRRVAPRPPLA